MKGTIMQKSKIRLFVAAGETLHWHSPPRHL
jgi:hypothetical protein